MTKTSGHGRSTHRPLLRKAAPLGLLLAASSVLGACGAKTDTATPTTAAAQTTSIAKGSTAPQDSRPKEGTTVPRAGTTTSAKPTGSTTTSSKKAGCRTVDLGGLTVSVPCDANVPDPESGVTLTADSVYGLPGESFDELADVDATNRVVTTEDGEPVTIYLLGSDTLFDVGSSTVKSTAEAALPTVIASMAKRSPNGKILVRGFTDSTGSAADNQVLSEKRAAAMLDWLADHGVDRSRMEASGYGSTHPAAEETSESGTALNRRIELIAVG